MVIGCRGFYWRTSLLFALIKTMFSPMFREPTEQEFNQALNDYIDQRVADKAQDINRAIDRRLKDKGLI